MTLVCFDDLKTFGIPFCRVHLNRLEKAGKFPRHIQISTQRIAWLRSEIESYIGEKVAERDQQAA